MLFFLLKDYLINLKKKRYCLNSKNEENKTIYDKINKSIEHQEQITNCNQNIQSEELNKEIDNDNEDNIDNVNISCVHKEYYQCDIITIIEKNLDDIKSDLLNSADDFEMVFASSLKYIKQDKFKFDFKYIILCLYKEVFDSDYKLCNEKCDNNNNNCNNKNNIEYPTNLYDYDNCVKFINDCIKTLEYKNNKVNNNVNVNNNISNNKSNKDMDIDQLVNYIKDDGNKKNVKRKKEIKEIKILAIKIIILMIIKIILEDKKKLKISKNKLY